MANFGRKRKIPGPNGPKDATEVGFRATGEYWNEYLLDDSTVIRFKIVVVSVLRVDGEYGIDGQPSYFLKMNNVMNVSAPDELMDPKGGAS